MGRVAGVILAAGAATRLGGGKQLLPLAGRPVLSHVVDAARATTLEPILVILGYEAAAIARQVDLTGLVVLHNPDYAAGQSSSVRLAVRALPDDVDAALFLLADQPEVVPTVVERIVAAFRERRAPIVQPRYREGRGNPVLIARPLFPEIATLTGDTGARPLLTRHAAEVELVDVSDFPRPEDIDTAEDYERIRTRVERRPPGSET